VPHKKMRPGFEPGPKALGNGGVSSRKTGASCMSRVNKYLTTTAFLELLGENGGHARN
jgi:hypothetical protein